MKLWDEIQRKMDDFGYMTQIDRSAQRVSQTAEIFTPTNLVIEILQKLDLSVFSPGKTVLDPACGDGQFLIAAKLVKVIHFKMDEEHALQDLYGVDIMRDNVDLCKTRLGGGNIYMGNSLDPNAILAGQTEFEHSEMIRLFSNGMGRKTTLSARKKSSSIEDDLWANLDG